MNIPFLKKFKKEQGIGLDLGVRELKIVGFQALSSGLYALNIAESLPLPEEEKDKVHLLKTFCQQHRLEGWPAAVSFFEESLHIRPLELPKMPKEDLVEAIRWQMRDVAEESMDNYIVQYALLDEKILPDIVHLNLMAFCIRMESVEKIQIFLQKAGLKPFFIEPTPVAMAAALEQASPSQGGGWIGCADLGYGRPYFIMVGNGKLRFVRPLAGIRGIDIADAEYPSKLSLELQNALDAFFIAAHAEKIDKIFLAGGGAFQKELPSVLSKNLGVPFEILNPFQGIERVQALPLTVEKPHLFGPAVGSALLKP